VLPQGVSRFMAQLQIIYINFF